MSIYKELISDLSWDNSDEVQSKAIEELSNLSIAEIRYLIQPNGKECWHNAAIAIYNIINKNNISSQEENFIFPLMEWTQDLNWPGALTIVDTLSLLDEDLGIKLIKHALEIAINDNDETWIDSLKYIVKKLNYVEKKSFQNNSEFEILYN